LDALNVTSRDTSRFANLIELRIVSESICADRPCRPDYQIVRAPIYIDRV